MALGAASVCLQLCDAANQMHACIRELWGLLRGEGAYSGTAPGEADDIWPHPLSGEQ